MAGLLRPPAAFAMVENGLYRSNTIDSRHFTFIRTLNLRSVLMLSLERFPPDVVQFFSENKTHVTHMGLLTWKPSEQPLDEITEELVKEAIEHMLDESNRPCLVMCTTGVRLTGTVIGCLRKLQHWCFSSLLDEHRSIASVLSTTYETSELYIELFDTDLITVPPNPAKWYRKSLEKDKQELRDREGVREDPDLSEVTGRVPAYLQFYFDPRCPLKSPSSTFGSLFSYD